MPSQRLVPQFQRSPELPTSKSPRNIKRSRARLLRFQRRSWFIGNRLKLSPAAGSLERWLDLNA